MQHGLGCSGEECAEFAHDDAQPLTGVTLQIDGQMRGESLDIFIQETHETLRECILVLRDMEIQILRLTVDLCSDESERYKQEQSDTEEAYGSGDGFLSTNQTDHSAVEWIDDDGERDGYSKCREVRKEDEEREAEYSQQESKEENGLDLSTLHRVHGTAKDDGLQRLFW